jgi:Glyoxalase-like domain
MFTKTSRFIGRLFLCPTLLFCLAFDGHAQSQKTMNVFPLERDHIFIWVSQGAPEAAVLQKLGLYTDGRIHKHVGQGTSSMVFMFENAYLELIWVDEPEVARRKSQEMGTDMLARTDWKQSGASPFGIGLHHRAAGSNDLPFPTKRYWAEWMKPDTFLLVAESSVNLKEPFYFVVPDYLAVPSAEQLKQVLASQPEYRKNFTHALGVRRLTGIKITSNQAGKFSETASMLSKNEVVVVKRGKSSHAELTFDGGTRGKVLDVRPTLPLILKY